MTGWENFLLYATGSLLIWIARKHGHQQQALLVQDKLTAARLRASIDVYFSPDGGCEEAICTEIDLAKQKILVMAYYLTSEEIINHLDSARSRGVIVRLIIDGAGGHAAQLQDLMRRVEHWVDKKHKIMHNKVMVIDDKVVVTGSFNFTENAEQSNAENLLILRSSTVADRYTGNWQVHKQHSDTGAA